ncbi:Polyprotein [Phytophthora palmivora]|uniref:Polyprotein n=1 Tax=Phytophthora palmivora TaxID=4796 RepID=A0A2P4YD70_9STRA|nr:Polyprotein [Phytophthora palmivora]
MRYHFIREHEQRKEVILQYVISKENVADTMTKKLQRSQFEYLRKELNVKLHWGPSVSTPPSSPGRVFDCTTSGSKRIPSAIDRLKIKSQRMLLFKHTALAEERKVDCKNKLDEARKVRIYMIEYVARLVGGMNVRIANVTAVKYNKKSSPEVADVQIVERSVANKQSSGWNKKNKLTESDGDVAD